jgi:carbonic anhydrase
VNAKVIIPAALAACIAMASFAGGKTHWGYSGHEGPEHWGSLDPDFSVCASGKNQSPINLSGFTEGDLAPIAFNFAKGGNFSCA